MASKLVTNHTFQSIPLLRIETWLRILSCDFRNSEVHRHWNENFQNLVWTRIANPVKIKC